MTWYDKVSNAEVNERTKLPDVPSLIADRRHSLFGHICHLLENTPASQALQLSIEAHTSTPPAADWKCLPGHPWRNWLQQVEEDIGLSVGAARIVSQDRSMWRTLRPSAGQVQQWVSEWVKPRIIRAESSRAEPSKKLCNYLRLCFVHDNYAKFFSSKID